MFKFFWPNWPILFPYQPPKHLLYLPHSIKSSSLQEHHTTMSKLNNPYGILNKRQKMTSAANKHKNSMKSRSCTKGNEKDPYSFLDVSIFLFLRCDTQIHPLNVIPTKKPSLYLVFVPHIIIILPGWESLPSRNWGRIGHGRRSSTGINSYWGRVQH